MSVLEEILTALAAKVEDMHLFGKVFTIVAIKYDGTNTFPAYYKGSGEYDPLILQDQFNGMTYFRKNGRLRFSENTDPKYRVNTSCDSSKILHNFIIPVKQVIFLPKDKVNCDNALAEDELAQQMIATLSDKQIRNINTKAASFMVSDYETVSSEVLKSEYSNWKEIVDINYNNIYISIDWDLEIVIDNDCLNPCASGS